MDDVISQHRNLLHEESAGTLCQILAKEAIFGKDLLARCTVTGKGGTLALPLQEMNDLKRKGSVGIYGTYEISIRGRALLRLRHFRHTIMSLLSLIIIITV